MESSYTGMHCVGEEGGVVMVWAEHHGATEIAPYRERCPLKLPLIERGVH